MSKTKLAAKTVRQSGATGKSSTLLEKHCEALLEANKKLDAFEEACYDFYLAIYEDVDGNREAFLAAVREAQVALRTGSLPNARVNDSAKKAGEWFDRVERSLR